MLETNDAINDSSIPEMTLITRQEETTLRCFTGSIHSSLLPSSPNDINCLLPVLLACVVRRFYNSRRESWRLSLEERVDKAEDTPYYTEHRRFHDATMLFVERRLCVGVYVCASIIVGVFALMIQLYVQYNAGGSVRPGPGTTLVLLGWLVGDVHRPR